MSAANVNAVWAEAQENVIGSMLISPECVPEVMANTDAADFTGFHQAAYSVIRRLDAAREPVDPVILLDAMGAEYKQRIFEVMQNTVTAANVGAYVRIVREQSRLAALRSLGASLVSVRDLEEAADIAAKIETLTVERRGLAVRSWAQMIDAFIEDRAEGKQREFLDWGIPALNETLHVSGGKYILIGGEASSGKSALMFQLAQHLSARRRVGLFSYETDEEEMSERMASSLSGVSFGDIIRNRLDTGDWKKLYQCFGSTKDNALETIDAAGMTAEDIAAISRARRYDVVFVDYVQLVTPSGSGRGNREQEVARISRTLQRLAKEAPGKVVVGLSQLSRPDKDRSGNVREPDLHAFRESGQLEQDADVAMILYKPFPKAESWSSLGKLRRLSIVKNKKDSLGRLNLRFDGDVQTFRYLSPGDAKRVENEGELEDPGEDLPFEQMTM